MTREQGRRVQVHHVLAERVGKFNKEIVRCMLLKFPAEESSALFCAALFIMHFIISSVSGRKWDWLQILMDHTRENPAGGNMLIIELVDDCGSKW